MITEIKGSAGSGGDGEGETTISRWYWLWIQAVRARPRRKRMVDRIRKRMFVIIGEEMIPWPSA
jgi:hypothetical protein